jgi:hypothetical protein
MKKKPKNIDAKSPKKAKKPVIQIVAKKIFAETGFASVTLHTKLRSGVWRDFMVERSLFTDRRKLHKFLVGVNASIDSFFEKAEIELIELIESEKVRAVGVVNTIGLYGTTFVTPHQSFGTDKRLEVFDLPESKELIVVGMQAGTLEGYLDAIRPVANTSRIFRHLLGAQCVSVAGPLVGLKTGKVFLLGGPSGLGKTVIIRLAMAIVGRADEEDPKTYSATEGGMEDYFFFYRNCLTVIDELGTASSDPKELVKGVMKLAYKFASGKGRQFTAIYKKMTGKSQRTWCQIAVMSNEKTLRQLAKEGGLRDLPEGALRRCIDIPISPDETVLDIHPDGDPPSARQVISVLSTACEGIHDNHGVALGPFVDWLIANKNVQADFEKIRDEFMRFIELKSGWQHAVVKTMAECCAGGVLGIRAGVVPCEEQAYIESLHELCYGLLKYSSSSFINVEKLARQLTKLCEDPTRVIVANKKGKYVGLNPETSLGYMTSYKDRKLAILFPQRVDELTGSRYATLDLGEYLKIRGRLRLGTKGSITQPVDVPGQKNQIRCMRLWLD